jgi:DNA replication ATP-dependent helicase Dna2
MSPVATPADHYFHRISEAVQRAGTVHAIRDFRAILESIFRQLTVTDNRSFSNIFGRIEYVFDRLSVPKYMREQVHGLRIYANRLTHQPTDPDPLHYQLALRAICETVQWFHDMPVPPELSAMYDRLGDRRFQRDRSRLPQEVPALKPVILEVMPLIWSSEGIPYFILHCRDEAAGDFQLELRQHPKNDLSKLHGLLRPWQTLYLFKLRKSEGRDDCYVSGPLTQVVIEPDLLIDISHLAECFQRNTAEPLQYLVKKLVPQETGEPAFLGNMVNALLDEAVRIPAPQFREVFREAVSENILQAAGYGREKLNEMYRTIQSMHWENVRRLADEVRTKPTRIEPSFLSARYGLQGRLDLLVEDADNPLRKDIIELKSGKPPDFNHWKNYEMQVVGYNMLLRSTFGEQRTGTSAILYSRAEHDSLRNVSSTHTAEIELLALRNGVVSALLDIAAGRLDILDAISPEVLPDAPPFVKDAFRHFAQAWRTAEPLPRIYYSSFLSFVVREFLNAKCGIWSAAAREDEGDGFAALWLHDEARKEARFGMLRPLRFEQFDGPESSASFNIDTLTHHNFRLGDTVILYPVSGGRLQPLHQQILKGRLEAVGAEGVTISLNNRQIDASYFQGFTEWVIEHDLYESSFWQMTASLFSVLDARHRDRFRMISGNLEPRSGLKPEIRSMGLNPNQVEILREALAAEDYYLIQGPPGTGKTSTFLTRLTRELLERDGALVVAAFTNRAVEEIATRLTEQGIPFMRLGNRKSASEAHLRALVRSGDMEAARSYVSGHRVFLATVATLTSRIDQLRLLRKDIHTLVVDEASQLTEPALISLVISFRKFILIGDQNQLPPVVAQDACFCQTNDPLLLAIGIRDLSGSLFERLMETARRSHWNHAFGMLTTHFRMHLDIARIINPWYGHRLICGRKEQEAIHSFDGLNDGIWHDLLSSGRAIFVPSPPAKSSRFHRTEAERIVSLIRYIQTSRGPSFDPRTVGVVTPWRTQIGLIKHLIGQDQALQAVNIDTVERFQGSENQMILVSMAVSHPAQMQTLRSPGSFYWEEGEGIHSVEVDRKLLVSLSRAMNQVVLFGDEHVLCSDPVYRRAISALQRYELPPSEPLLSLEIPEK